MGIGAGEDGDVDYISINGGTIEALGGDDIHRAIGGEDDEDLDGEHLSLGSGLKVYTTFPAPLGDVNLQWGPLRQSQMMDYGTLKIQPCDHAGQELGYVYVDDDKHRFFCKWCGFVTEDHTGDFSCDKCDYSGTPHIVRYYELVYDEQSQQYKYPNEVTSVPFKNSFILPELSSSAPADKVFAGWATGAPDANDDGTLYGNETLYSPGQAITASGNVDFKARYVNKTLDLATVTSNQTVFDGEVVTGTLNTPVKITIADGATVTLNNVTINGVNSNDYKWAGINCKGNATIILEGENTVKGFYEDYPGVWVLSSYTLTIKGTGSLNASSNGFGAGIGSAYGSDIQNAGTIYIQSGNITATGGKYAAGIESNWNNNCGHIMISGGTINATGGAAGIGSGWGDPNNSSYSSSCGLVSISDNVTSVTATKGEYSANSIGAGYAGSCTSVAIGSQLGAITRSPYNYIPLANATNNSAKISDFSNDVCDVTLKGRTLYKDGGWNTICLPFGVTLADSPLAGAEARTLSSANLDNDGVLTLNFSESVTTLEAGKPYIIKWASSDNIENPMFTNVTITNTESNDIDCGDITFAGTYNPVVIGSEGDDTKLYLSSGNMLYWPNAAMRINAFRAYFQLNLNSNVRGFSMAFLDNEEATGIESVNSSRYDSDAWYTLDGRKINGKPAMSGMYINNGRKVVIK